LGFPAVFSHSRKGEWNKKEKKRAKIRTASKNLPLHSLTHNDSIQKTDCKAAFFAVRSH
jgi:hypothetical protein